MDYCVKIFVAISVLSQMVCGGSYFNRRSDDRSLHRRDSDHDPWQNIPPTWNRHVQAPAYYQRHHNTVFDKEYLHNQESKWNTGSSSENWGYPDLHSTESTESHPGHYNWGHHYPVQPGQHKRSWHEHAPWMNGPYWNHGPIDCGPITPRPLPKTTTSRSQESQAQLAITMCIRGCPVTPEYNPVCGSNNVTYSNIGRLQCAINCGVDVTFRRNSACPPPGFNNVPMTQTTSTTSTTRRPFEPTPTPTIPPDVINQIFNTQPTEAPTRTTTDDNYEIDIRTRSRARALLQVHPVPYIWTRK